MRGGRQRRIRQRRHAGRVGVDQLLLAAVPVGEHHRVGQAPDQAGMDQAGKVNPRNVPRASEHALEIPDGFLRAGEMIGEETTAVLPREETVEAPLRIGLGADVEQVHHQQVARLGAVHTHRAGEVMHGGQVHITHIAGVVVVLDRTGGPVVGLQDEVIAGLDPTGHRDIRVPAVMDIFVFGDRLVEVDFDQRFGHGLAPGRMAWCVRSSLREPGKTGNTLDDV